MCAESNKKGFVIVAVLWVVVLLVVIIAAVGRSSRLDTKICLAGTDEVRCKWACRAGVDTAIAVLNDDQRGSDCLKDLWSENENDFNDIELEGCSFNVRVVDEAGKLNVNTATKLQLLGLPNMTEEIAEAILDWRDKNDAPRQAGVEGGYYENLTFGYKIRNGPFRTIRELLLVKGVTEELLYGEDTNFNGELDYNERDGDKSPPADNGDEKIDEGWIVYLTCYSADENKDATGNERVNINEADEAKLSKSLGIKSSHAKWIVKNRQRNRYANIADLINNGSPEKASDSSNKDSNEAEPLDLETFSKIADKITVNNSKKIPGRVNINTSPKVVLAALLGGGDSAERLAEDIITYRGGLAEGMQSIVEVLQVKSVKVGIFKRIANLITTRSNIFTIHCFATAERNGGRIATEAVVDRSGTSSKILYWYQGAR